MAEEGSGARIGGIVLLQADLLADTLDFLQGHQEVMPVAMVVIQAYPICTYPVAQGPQPLLHFPLGQGAGDLLGFLLLWVGEQCAHLLGGLNEAPTLALSFAEGFDQLPSGTPGVQTA